MKLYAIVLLNEWSWFDVCENVNRTLNKYLSIMAICLSTKMVQIVFYFTFAELDTFSSWIAKISVSILRFFNLDQTIYKQQFF